MNIGPVVTQLYNITIFIRDIFWLYTFFGKFSYFTEHSVYYKWLLLTPKYLAKMLPGSLMVQGHCMTEVKFYHVNKQKFQVMFQLQNTQKHFWLF